MNYPAYIDVFISPIRDNETAQIAIVAVLFLIVLDVVFGLVNSLLKKNYSSDKMREGLTHKIAELGVMIIAVIADGTFIAGLDIGYSTPILVTVCIYLAIMELGSLLEIFALMNPQLGNNPLFKILDSVHIDETDDEEL